MTTTTKTAAPTPGGYTYHGDGKPRLAQLTPSGIWIGYQNLKPVRKLDDEAHAMRWVSQPPSKPGITRWIPKPFEVLPFDEYLFIKFCDTDNALKFFKSLRQMDDGVMRTLFNSEVLDNPSCCARWNAFVRKHQPQR